MRLHLLALALGAFLGFACDSPVAFLLAWWAFALAFTGSRRHETDPDRPQGNAAQATRWPSTKLRSRSGCRTSTLSPQA